MHLARNLSKHSTTITEMTIKECGGMDAILKCINDFDVMVRESALQAIGSVVRQDASLSHFIVTSGTIILNVLYRILQTYVAFYSVWNTQGYLIDHLFSRSPR